MRVFDKVAIEDSPYYPMLNTGTSWDLATGAFVPGVDGHMYLNGGLAHTNGVAGRPNSFKSTLLDALLVGSMCIYPDVNTLEYDSEGSKKRHRVIGNHGWHLDDPIAREMLNADIDARYKLINLDFGDLIAVNDLVGELANEKIKHADDYTVETPILDPKTGKPMRIILPTLIGYDSFSEADSDKIYETLDKHGADAEEAQILAMRSGAIKTRTVYWMNRIAPKAGLYFGLTAHVGNFIPMSKYDPTPRDLPDQKLSDKMKGVGSKFLFLMSNCCQIVGSETLLSSDKKASKYPYSEGGTAINEFRAISGKMTRSKNHGSGGSTTYVMSESSGMLHHLNYYDYLRDAKRYGLPGNDTTHRIALTPDVSLTRTQTHTKLLPRKVQRALEILYQICYIHNNWSTGNFGMSFDIDPEKIPDMLGAQSYAVEDILNSRGYWTWDKNNPLPYLSVFDIVSILNGKYKPTLHAVAPGATVLPFVQQKKKTT